MAMAAIQAAFLFQVVRCSVPKYCSILLVFDPATISYFAIR
jgi:hypothetical protein